MIERTQRRMRLSSTGYVVQSLLLLARLDIEQGFSFIMKSCSISLLVKSDLLREGLYRLLSDSEFEIDQSVGDFSELNSDLDDENHIIILYRSLDETSSIDDYVQIISGYAKSRSVILTDKFDQSMMKKYFQAGVCGYILSDTPSMNFLAMIKLVSTGEKVVPSQFIEIMNQADLNSVSVNTTGVAPHEFDLSERDIRILDKLSLGLSNKMISRDLGISEATVKVAIKAIYRKLSVNNRTQAAILAREINLLPRHGECCVSTTNGGVAAHISEAFQS